MTRYDTRSSRRRWGEDGGRTGVGSEWLRGEEGAWVVRCVPRKGDGRRVMMPSACSEGGRAASLAPNRDLGKERTGGGEEEKESRSRAPWATGGERRKGR
jgi:hypothetical protein